MSWASERAKAQQEGRFETKVAGPSYSTKPGTPHRARKGEDGWWITPGEHARIEQAVQRVERVARKSGGQPISEARKRELERRFDRLAEQLGRFARETRREENGNTREHTEHASLAVSESQMPEAEVYWAAWNMRSVCMDLLSGMLPVPTPLVRWRSPDYMRRTYGEGVVGMTRRDLHSNYVEVDNSLTPRETASVVSHELLHTAQFGIGAANLSDAERKQAEEQANRFSLLAYAEYMDRYGPLPS